MNELEHMMVLQKKLQIDSYGADPADLMEEERVEFIRWNVLAMEDELHEALAETGWKPWATSRHVNREAFIGELVDAWHFMMNLLLTVECSPDEFYARYIQKRTKNAQRQAEGYDGVSTKCPGCKRALDDDGVNCYEISDGGGYHCVQLGRTYLKPRLIADNPQA